MTDKNQPTNPNTDLAYFDRPEVRERLRKPILTLAIADVIIIALALLVWVNISWVAGVLVLAVGFAIVLVVLFPKVKAALGEWEKETELDKAAGRVHKENIPGSGYGS